eukprot:CAMPEP_0171068810 /NCGR_PEP_ID=MMETSP0766_2-20121228/8785_1 /TAXON_ID=439317 /ORGANISM="Gambierdiscus australes, Strain CAWD 149" /LENGTH=391 /DNA_ID=CAMNT_0011525159 /DNA_START=105 /DNA_END=1280 /DNA_ORIENTATION=+
MGCCSSAQDIPPVVSERRRLSVASLGAVEGKQEEGSDGDRGLLKSLNSTSIIEMVQEKGQGGRKFSIGSETDDRKTSFQNKKFNQIGEDVDPLSCGLGFTCRKGLKPESPNQDSWSVLKVDGNYSIYGVYDGHGQKGHDVSNFVKDNLPKLMIRDQRFKTGQMSEMCTDAFKRMQSLIFTMDSTGKLSAQMSGTTATIVIHDHTENQLTISHVADSTAVLGQFEDESKKKVKGIPLTRDHKPNLKDEKARIEKAGGRVVFDGYANHRVYAKNGRYPGLNMSRCLGDLLGHQEAGCTSVPEVTERQLTPLDYCLLLCSDGVWEFITPQEAVQIVSKYGPNKAMPAAEYLAKEAWDRWIQEEGGAVVDDITVVLVFLQAGANSAQAEAPAQDS